MIQLKYWWKTKLGKLGPKSEYYQKASVFKNTAIMILSEG